MTEFKVPCKFEENYCPDLFSWKEFGNIINIRPLMSSERINVFNGGVNYRWNTTSWTLQPNCYPPTLLREVMEEHICYLKDMSRCTEKVNAFSKKVEDIYQQEVDAHIYMCRNIDRIHPFGIHFDWSHNVIVQCEGQTNFKVWDEIEPSKAKEMLNTHKSTLLTLSSDPILDVEMKPGDAIWIPRFYPHLATSRTKRLSISFAFNKKLDRITEDRNWVTFDD